MICFYLFCIFVKAGIFEFKEELFMSSVQKMSIFGNTKEAKKEEANFNEEQIKKDLEAVKQDPYAVKYVEDQTPEICLEAVKQDGDALQYVKDQTPEICLAAVQQDGRALGYVKNQTPEIC